MSPEAATAALTVFADLEHLAPAFGLTQWQPQAPVLAAKIAEFRGRPSPATVLQLREVGVELFGSQGVQRAHRSPSGRPS